jgi:mRNA-degrading endonuclease YafQ of YafQ-DinJ toxin-antitoxin module
MPGHTQQNILFLAYVRRIDQVILAEHGNNDCKEKVHNIVKDSKFEDITKPHKRNVFVTENSAFHLRANDAGLVAIAVTAKNYPQRVAFNGLCKDMMSAFEEKNLTWQTATENQFKGKLKGVLTSLTKEFDDLASKSKIEALKGQVANVKEVAGHNIEKALANLETTDEIATESDALLVTAKQFNKSSKKLAWKEWCAMMKLYLIVAAIIIIIAVIVFFIFWKPTAAASPSPKRRFLNDNVNR